MNNAISTVTANGSRLTFSVATDSRILSVNAVTSTVVAKSDRDAADLQSEATAWGCTSVVFISRSDAKRMGYAV